MKKNIKLILQDGLAYGCLSKYKKEVARQQDPYSQWILANEGSLFDVKKQEDSDKKWKKDSVLIIPYEDCEKGFSMLQVVNANQKIAIFVDRKKGILSKQAISQVISVFKDEYVDMVYGDEDYITPVTKEKYKRSSPWFKPEYGPDTLLSHFFMGSLFAVRIESVKNISGFNNNNYYLNLYDFVLKASEEFARKLSMVEQPILANSNLITNDMQKEKNDFARNTPKNIQMQKKIMHLSKVLFHNYLCDEEKIPLPIGVTQEFNFIKKEAIVRRGYEGQLLSEGIDAIYSVVYQVKEDPMVSIVIPSKDNVEVLEVCLSSIREKTSYPNYEIIVVDNGSIGANRVRMEQLKKKYNFFYLYEPMSFNFSKMCNLGAKQSNGEFLLLLNDDMEIIQADWMTRLVGQGQLEEVGAVGAKLLFPDSKKIQHVGITNMAIGPAHKLSGLSDEIIYYHGQNRLVFDMIGVTAACLLVQKEKYFLVNGLREELEIAYNDVDFNFKLHELGFANVLRNDVVLYHHESLSRGDDFKNTAKWKRLLGEKDILYKHHKTLYQKDPYYSEHLVKNSILYTCHYLYEFEKRDFVSKASISKDFTFQELQEKRNACLKITMESAGLERKIETKEEDVYLVEGWSYVFQNDNCRFVRTLVLIDEQETIWELPVLSRYRKDVAKVLPDERNVELAGFVCRIKKEELQVGEYRVAMIAKDTCSRLLLFEETDRILQVKNED